MRGGGGKVVGSLWSEFINLTGLSLLFVCFLFVLGTATRVHEIMFASTSNTEQDSRQFLVWHFGSCQVVCGPSASACEIRLETTWDAGRDSRHFFWSCLVRPATLRPEHLKFGLKPPGIQDGTLKLPKIRRQDSRQFYIWSLHRRCSN